jgi:hypothetical protein
MTDRDEVAELADRSLAKQRRGEELGIEFEIEFGSLTDEERADFMALMKERAAHGKEKLEALDEDNRVLSLLLAYQQGAITAMEFVERVRGAVPDPLAE